MDNKPLFHSGELEVQKQSGDSLVAARNGAIVTLTVPLAARPFLEQQNLVLLATHDATGHMWASMLFGDPGFLRSHDGRTFEVDLNRASNDPNDPLWANLNAEGETPIGSLVIDLSTRRRLRINGTAHIDASRILKVKVEASYPACPKYITRRSLSLEAAASPAVNPVDQPSFPIASIELADGFFVATQSPIGGLDISHRGGNPGVLEIIGPNTFRWMEYSGNGMYNTLGNLVHDPHAGIVLADYRRRRLLQLTGTAKTVWAGSAKSVEFQMEEWLEHGLPPNLTSTFIDYSPYNPR